MGRLAYVFPGQGSQYVGMGQALVAASPAAAAVFEEADAALGEPISQLAFNGPAELLDLTMNSQPALVATSIAYLAALRERWAAAGIPEPKPDFVVGHSMGQYAALVAAGSIPLGESVRLVRERGHRMQTSGAGREGRMAALLGLDDAQLPELIRRAGEHGVVTVANRNSPGQTVISGERAAIEAAAEIAKELGARKAVVLPVSVAAHSPLMQEAADGMRNVLEPVAFADPQMPLLANADGTLITTAAAAKGELVEHLTRGVDWIGTIEKLAADGVTTFVEVGPGSVLTGLIKRIAPEAELFTTDDKQSPERLAVPFLPATAG